MKSSQPDRDRLQQIDALLTAAARLNELFPDAVLVGGTAAAIYARHRLSTDTDFILPGMKDRYEEAYQILDLSPDWTLARASAPVVIMGNFHGVETTLRQLIRRKPLQTRQVEGPDGPVTVPTLDEIIRIKAWLALTRNAYRDYLDLAALSDVAGMDHVRNVMATFDDYYADVTRAGMVRDVSPCLQLMRQLFSPRPYDLEKQSEIEHYKSVISKWSDPRDVLARCQEIGFAIADHVFSQEPKVENDLATIAQARKETGRPEMPPYPADTHEAHVSKDGSVIVIRTRPTPEGGCAKVDNPLGPAVLGPDGERYALQGRFMSEQEWIKRIAPASNPSKTS